MFVLSRLWFFLSLFFACASSAQELKVAAASDLTAVMEQMAPAFEKKTGVHVSVSMGSSGNFFAQIQNGAPFDVFLSADKSYPEKLQQSGKAEGGTLTFYARGRLALWIPNGSALQFGSKEGVLNGDLKLLTGPRVQKIAIANPEHAPYGRAAVAALQHYKVYGQVKSKLVLGENIAQTAQFVQSGNADVAFISYSLALTRAMQSSGHWLLLSDDSYSPIEQAGVVMSASQNKDAGRRFLQFLTTPEAQAILREYGFETPQK